MPLNSRGQPRSQRRTHASPTSPTEADFGFSDIDYDADVPRRRRRRPDSSPSSSSPSSLLASPTSAAKWPVSSAPKPSYARKTGSLATSSATLRQQSRPRPSQLWNPPDIDEEIRRDIVRRREEERALTQGGYLALPPRSAAPIASMGESQGFSDIQTARTFAAPVARMNVRQRLTDTSNIIYISDSQSSSETDPKEEGIEEEATQKKEEPIIQVSPISTFRAPVAYMGGTQTLTEIKTQDRSTKAYARKTASNSRPEISTTQKPAVTEASQHQTAAAFTNKGQRQNRPHTSDLKIDQAMTRGRIRTGRPQNPSRAAKKSAYTPRAEHTPAVQMRKESSEEAPKEASEDETIPLAPFLSLRGDDELDDAEEDVYDHTDKKGRMTAAQPSTPKRKRASLPASPKKSSKISNDSDIRAGLRPANQPPPKLQFSPNQVKTLGLAGIAKLEKGKIDRSFDKNAPGYSEHNRYSRYINRTDWSRTTPPKPKYPPHVTSGDFYYPAEVPKVAKAPSSQQQQRASMTATAPHQQRQQQMRSAPATPQRQQPPREAFQVRADETPPQTSGPQSPRTSPAWMTSKWMDEARKMAEDPLKKFLNPKKD